MPGYTTSSFAVDPPGTLVDVSADGNVATFRSTGVGDQEIFAIDIATGQRTLVERYTGPFTAAEGPSTVQIGLNGGQLSADGRYVLYQIGELQGRLPTTPIESRLLVKDLFTGTTRTVVQDDRTGIGLVPLDIDGGGGVVLFQRFTGSGSELVLRNLVTGTEQAFPRGQPGELAQGSNFEPLSADGLTLAYRPPGQGIVARDLATGAVSTPAPGGSVTLPESLSADGRYLLVGDGGTVTRLDTTTGETLVVTTAASGLSFALSDSGRYASYFTTTGETGVVLKDLATGQSVTLPTAGFATGLPTNNGTLVVQLGNELVEVRFATPVVTLDTIAGDGLVNGAEKAAPIVVSGTSDQLGGLVELRAGGALVATATVGQDGTWATQIDLAAAADGPLTVSARVENFGKGGTATASLLVDSMAFLNIGAIGNGDDIVNATESVILYGESDAFAGTITLVLDGAALGQATALANGVWQFNGAIPVLADGIHVVQASSADAAGNAASATRSFTVDRTPPVIAITALGDNGTLGATGSALVTGTSDALFRTVSLLADGVAVGQAVVQADGSWQASVDIGGLAGSLTLVASVSDLAGNVATDTESAFADRRFVRVSEGSNGEQGAPVFIPGVAFTVVGFPSFDEAADQLAFSAFFYSLGPDPEPDDFVGPYLGKTYVKNLATGELVPVAAGAPDGSLLATLSPDGGYVAFATRARLLPSDTNGGAFTSTDVSDGIDIYLKNLATGALTLVSAAPDGSASGDSATTFLYVGYAETAQSIAVSENGRVVAWLRETEFTSSNGLVNRATELVVRDVVAGTSTVLTPPDQVVPSLAQRIALSRDGDVVAWQAKVNYSAQFENNPGGPPVYDALYGGNWRTGTVGLLNTNAAGFPISTGLPGDAFFAPIFSADGSKVAFQSRASLWVKDFATGALTQAVTWGATAVPPFFTAFLPDGRILFNTDADLPGVADPAGIDLFAVDPTTGAVTLVASGDLAILTGAVSGNGKLLALTTIEALEAADTNGEFDIYVTPVAPTTVAITAAGGSVAALSVAGTAGAIGATVSLFIDGVAAGNAVVAADGTWAATLAGTGVGTGPHQLRATITDALGFSSSDGATVTLGAGGTVTGVVLDGYIAGATVWADADADGVLDPGETFTITNGAGSFTLDADGVRLATTGGTDIATGLAQPFTFLAPDGFTAITALSTLVALAGGDLAPFTSLLPAPALAQSGDVLAAARAGDAAAQAQLLVITQVGTALSLGAQVVAARDGVAPGAAHAALAAAVATAIAGSATPPDLAAFDALVAAQAADGDAALADALANALGSILENLRLAMGTPGGDAAGFVATLAAVARLGQLDAAHALADAVAAGGALDTVVAAFSGAALDTAIAAARGNLGDVDGPGFANAPIAVADAFTLAEDTVLVVAASSGVLANDSDLDGDTLAATLVSGPAHGVLLLGADGGFTYAPAPDFNGTDSFTYRAADGALGTLATVTFTVTPVDDPVLPVPPALSYFQGGAGVPLGALLATPVAAPALVSVGTGAAGTLVENTDVWNAIKAVQLDTYAPGMGRGFTVANFVDARLDLSAATQALDVAVIGAKRGLLLGGAGDDSLAWVAHSNGGALWSDRVVLGGGGGDDTISIRAVASSTADDALLADNARPGNGALWNARYDGRLTMAEVDGGAGNDTIQGFDAVRLVATGGAGDDRGQAGGGAQDEWVVAGVASGYVVAISGGTVTLTDTSLADGNDGTDTLTGFEFLRFADGSLLAL
jgi:Tol biopolymer transport system component